MAEINGTSSSTQERADERYTFVSRRYIAIATNRAIIVKDYVRDGTTLTAIGDWMLKH